MFHLNVTRKVSNFLPETTVPGLRYTKENYAMSGENTYKGKTYEHMKVPPFTQS